MARFSDTDIHNVIDGPWRSQTDGGDGGGDDMDARVSRLEADMKDVKSVLYDTVVPALTRIEERLNHTATKAELEGVRAQVAEKPGRGFVIGTVIAIFALCAGMVAATVAGLQYVQGAF